MNRKETYKTKILTVYINWNPIYVVQTIKNNHISQLQVVTSFINALEDYNLGGEGGGPPPFFVG